MTEKNEKKLELLAARVPSSIFYETFHDWYQRGSCRHNMVLETTSFSLCPQMEGVKLALLSQSTHIRVYYCQYKVNTHLKYKHFII